MRTTIIGIVLLAVAGAFPFEAQKRKPKKPTPTLSTATKAPEVTQLSKREKDMIDEINLARTKPAEYLQFLQDFRRYYNGKNINFPDGRILVTNEGVSALDDAIEFIRKLSPVPPLELRTGLVLAARTHVNDLDKTGKSGHTGSDGSKPQDRFNRYGTWTGSVGENIVYDSRTPRYDIIGIIIDDGVSNRGHRRNLFQTNFRAVGVAVGQPTKSPTLAIITFAGDFADKTRR